MKEEKELSAFEYLPRILPVVDAILIIWVALTSPVPWITTPIHLCIPLVGFTSLYFFRKRGRIGAILVGAIVAIPLFFLNRWNSPTCPTWMMSITYISGGLLLTETILDSVMVLVFSFVATIVPAFLNHSSLNFTCTIAIAQVIMWFLMNQSSRFMNLQRKRIEAQKLVVEEKQKEILDSIRYAQRIQSSLLPSEKKVHQDLNRNRHE